MQLGHVLTIIGILISLGFGVWGAAVMLRRRYPGQITFVRESCIGLFEAIVKNLPELSVLYKDAPVGEGLVLLKGAFLNTGSKDITDLMIEDDLNICLPEGFRWLTGKIVATSPNIKTTIDVRDDRLSFDTGLLRCGEYVRFEALAEVPLENAEHRASTRSIGRMLSSALKITHRIADTQKVLTTVLSEVSFGSSFSWVFGIMLILLVSGGIGYSVYSHFQGWPAKANFIMFADNGNTIEVKIEPRMNGMVRVQGVDDKQFENTLPVKQFFSTEGLQPKLVRDRELYFPYFMLLSITILTLLFSIFAYRRDRKVKRLRQLLSINGVDSNKGNGDTQPTDTADKK